jgi:hypothetical protein
MLGALGLGRALFFWAPEVRLVLVAQALVLPDEFFGELPRRFAVEQGEPRGDFDLLVQSGGD